MGLGIGEVFFILVILGVFAALGFALWKIVRSASQK